MPYCACYVLLFCIMSYVDLPCKHSLRGEECGIVPVILTFHS